MKTKIATVVGSLILLALTACSSDNNSNWINVKNKIGMKMNTSNILWIATPELRISYMGLNRKGQPNTILHHATEWDSLENKVSSILSDKYYNMSLIIRSHYKTIYKEDYFNYTDMTCVNYPLYEITKEKAITFLNNQSVPKGIEEALNKNLGKQFTTDENLATVWADVFNWEKTKWIASWKDSLAVLHDSLWTYSSIHKSYSASSKISGVISRHNIPKIIQKALKDWSATKQLEEAVRSSMDGNLDGLTLLLEDMFSTDFYERNDYWISELKLALLDSEAKKFLNLYRKKFIGNDVPLQEKCSSSDVKKMFEAAKKYYESFGE